MVIAFIFTAYFFLLTLLEILSALNLFGFEGGMLMNAFVLGTVTATYLKGLIVKKDSYKFVASLIASAFSTLAILVYLASGSFSYGIFGFIAVPYAVKELGNKK